MRLQCTRTTSPGPVYAGRLGQGGCFTAIAALPALFGALRPVPAALEFCVSRYLTMQLRCSDIHANR
jgi:hypothetical protein